MWLVRFIDLHGDREDWFVAITPDDKAALEAALGRPVTNGDEIDLGRSKETHGFYDVFLAKETYMDDVNNHSIIRIPLY